MLEQGLRGSNSARKTPLPRKQLSEIPVVILSALMRALVECLAVFVITAGTALAVDWPEWRGPNRDGISAETGLLTSWPEGGPPLLWTTRGLGEGFASFGVSGGKVFTQGQSEGQQFLIALD